LILSPVDSVHLIWPHLEMSLQRVKDKTGERWSPVFVLKRIQEGAAALFRFSDNGRHIAYMVCERYDQGEVWMNVWIVEGAGLEMFDECLPLVDGLAKSIGATSWRCTGRKGWAKFLKPVATVYERELT
jgi:hypothetical protein